VRLKLLPSRPFVKQTRDELERLWGPLYPRVFDLLWQNTWKHLLVQKSSLFSSNAATRHLWKIRFSSLSVFLHAVPRTQRVQRKRSAKKWQRKRKFLTLKRANSFRPCSWCAVVESDILPRSSMCCKTIESLGGSCIVC